MTSITTLVKHSLLVNCYLLTQTKDVYEDFFKHKNLFIFSNYSKNSKCFDQTNKKVIGKMKVVSEGKIVDEFVWWKSKVYSMKDIDGKESNTEKGVNIATEFI